MEKIMEFASPSSYLKSTVDTREKQSLDWAEYNNEFRI
jgi:hypothetical protein